MARTVFTNANLLDGSNPAIAGANVVVDDERPVRDLIRDMLEDRGSEERLRVESYEPMIDRHHAVVDPDDDEDKPWSREDKDRDRLW